MLRTLSLATATLLAAQLCNSAMAQDVINNDTSAISTPRQQDAEHEGNQFQTAFLKRQVDQNMSVGRAISSIAGHYPQEIVSIVDIALETYPEKYREIIFAAISAHPASTEEIVQLAIEKEVSSCPNIVPVSYTHLTLPTSR